MPHTNATPMLKMICVEVIGNRFGTCPPLNTGSSGTRYAVWYLAADTLLRTDGACPCTRTESRQIVYFDNAIRCSSYRWMIRDTQAGRAPRKNLSSRMKYRDMVCDRTRSS